MSKEKTSNNVLIVFFYLLLITSFGVSIGWTAMSFDDPPLEESRKELKNYNEPIRMLDLILACIASVISIYFIINIFKQSNWKDIYQPILFIAASAMTIANTVVTDRKARGDALGISTMTVNGLAFVVASFFFYSHFMPGVKK